MQFAIGVSILFQITLLKAEMQTGILHCDRRDLYIIREPGIAMPPSMYLVPSSCLKADIRKDGVRGDGKHRGYVSTGGLEWRTGR